VTVLIFEDSQVQQLAPITTGRAACSITMGSYSLLDRIKSLGVETSLWLRSYLRQLYALNEPDLKILGSDSPRAATETNEVRLAINARVVPSSDNIETLNRLLARQDSQPAVVRHGDQIAAILNPGWTTSQIQDALDQPTRLLDDSSEFDLLSEDLELISFPHEVVAANMKLINGNLEHRIATQALAQKTDGIFVGENVTLGDYLVTDTSHGPIVIENGASVGPYTLLRGPIYIGSGCKVLEHSAIKDEVSLGHTTKVGGEVEAAVIEPYTNKQHHGFLGHCYLGSWINLGAGTCNSDLKNTYGTVNMEYGSTKTATGMQFLGCVMGDYAKSAINTGIFTGKVIGVCSMLYGFVTSNVPSFVNYARLFGQLATLPPDVMIATQQRMFSRRKVEQRPCDIQLMHDMYRLTQGERDKFGDEIVF
jgi:UDP-N-acetylglucosamine diphosphorylase/glucosamine-1-phosphate N-acetyltransferase